MAVTPLSERLHQHALAWSSSLATLALFILTILYASQSYSLSNIRSIRSSSANTILVLRVLSELTSILLAISLALTLEHIKWRLIVRKRGQKLADFLSLVPGTSILGLLQLLLKRGVLWSSWRIWSITRLALLALLPIRNVVIFSDINTRLTYHLESTKVGNFSGALGNFNASSATTLGNLVDSIFGFGFADFLSDSRIAIDITPNAQGNIPCSAGTSKTSKQYCNQLFFMPGTILDLDILRNGSLPKADLLVLHNSPGYMLNFTTRSQGVTFDLEKDCRVYGHGSAAFQLCFQDHEDTLEMKLNGCLNTQKISMSDCMTRSDWQDAAGASTRVSISTRNATVAFSRLNTTIQSYRLCDNWTPAKITSANLVSAFDGFFGSEEGLDEWLEDITSSIVGSKPTMAPIVISSFAVVSQMSYSAEATVVRNTNALQSLLAISLWYCSQALYINLGRSIARQNGTVIDLAASTSDIFESLPSATYSLATSSYELVVGRATIWAYAILGGVFLLLIFVALSICTLTDGEARRPTTTSFADVDHRRLEFEGLNLQTVTVSGIQQYNNNRVILRESRTATD